MINANQNLKIVRCSAAYDLLVTASFMTPWSAAWLFEMFAGLSSVLGLQRPVPQPDASFMLFVNLLGSVVVVWSLWRWWHPTRLVGLYDALARALFALWQVYAVTQGASFLLLEFTLMEIVFGVAQVLPVRPLRAGHPACTKPSIAAASAS